ncbi:hypothetical protein PV11_00468 [Exophiala sideris]|uniref:Uncharacterized protein n=1 Tax=Exophiala sideris TaxID=1016849 RepID=A0A0D1W7K3_9EURO|nr:hypothetical protein PV11_00468 [Exophiala sideris]
MSGARPLGERSANIPAKSGVKSTDDKPKSGKKRKSDEPAINPDDIELPDPMLIVSRLSLALLSPFFLPT